ncbi:MAG: class I SAM-dependent methyltransferase [Acidobacteriota bacterium]
MNLTRLLQNPPRVQRNGDGQFVEMGLTGEVLDFTRQRIDASSRTLETGCGVSTVIFALSGARHICITPAEHEIQRIKEYCRAENISTDAISFYADSSEKVLPALQCEPLDLVLIDGRHGFPAPFIDFYYAAAKLKIGGLLVVDDTWLWTGEVLKQILMSEPEWKLEADFAPRTVVFRKLAEGSETKEWSQQKFVVNHSAFKLEGESPSALVTAGRFLKRGEFSDLGRKIARKLGGAGKPA